MPATVPQVSATLAAHEALERRRRAGETVLPMAFGEAGLPAHPLLKRALAEAAGANGYGPVAGTPLLRENAAGYWDRRGLPTDADLVVAGPGSKPLIYALLLAIGGDIAVPMPSWVSYAAQTRLIRHEPILVATPPGQGGVPEPDLLAAAVKDARARGRDVRAVIVTVPDNPTGTLAEPATVKRLCAVAEDLDLIIISDEIYRDLVFDSAQPYASPADFAPDHTVITTALSKNLALGGWRIGVARLPTRELAERVKGVGSEIWSSPSGPVQQAAAYAFSEPPELRERVEQSTRLHAIVARAVTDRFVAAGAIVAPPQAAFYIYPDLSDLGRPGQGGPEFAELLLSRYGMGVLPGMCFGDTESALRFRVATSLLYGYRDEEREVALAADEPLALPWIKAHLDRLDEVLGELVRQS